MPALNAAPQNAPQNPAAIVAHETRVLRFGVAQLLVCYIGAAAAASARTPLWMDEILTVWASRLGSAKQIYAALAHGSEFGPPTYPLLLHFLAKVTGGGNLALRIPSIAGVVVTGCCSLILFRRHLGLPRAAFALCLVLEAIWPFTIQVRPYALETACMAGALLLWDDLGVRASWWRCVWIGLLLALAASLHFYGVLFVPCLGLIELIYFMKSRIVRTPVWIALVAAGASIGVWLPLIHTMSHYISGDAGSPNYYAQPNVGRFIQAWCSLFLQGPWTILLLIFAMLAIAAGRLREPESSSQELPEESRPAEFWAVVVGMALFPCIVFLFSCTVTKTFNERYAIASVIGMAALVAGTIRATPFFRRTLPMILLFASVSALLQGISSTPAYDLDAITGDLPGNDPIVIGDGLAFFPLMESSPAAIRSRFVYVTLPEETPIGDPTNEHQIERWKAINPTLPVESVTEFLQQNPRFYLVDWQTSDDTPVRYLLGLHRIELEQQAGKTLVFRSR